MAIPEPPAADGSSPQQRKFDQEPPMVIDTDKRYTATMVTSHGTMVIALDPLAAPKTVNSFVFLARYHYYDGVIFHRIIPGFVLQGGDPTGTGMGSPGYKFADEFDPNLNFDRAGRLAMANSGPNTNGSQFFITEQPAEFLNQHYTLFGQCDDASVEVVKAIARVPRNSSDKPNTPVVLKKITIVRGGQPKP